MPNLSLPHSTLVTHRPSFLPPIRRASIFFRFNAALSKFFLSYLHSVSI
jgi:hypothetical protein